MSTPLLSIVIPLHAPFASDGRRDRLLYVLQSWRDGLVRHAIEAELVLVAWNAKADQEKLAALIGGIEGVKIRLLVVPASLHQSLPHADHVPIFDHLAQNIGLRRSLGRWVLLTHADIFLSDALFAWLASGKLEAGHLYRADRYDLDLPLDCASANPGDFPEHLCAIQTRREMIDLKARGADVSTLRVPSDKYVDSWGQFGLLALTFLAESRFVLKAAFDFLRTPSSVALSTRLGLFWKILSAEWRNVGLMFKDSLGVLREREKARLFFADCPVNQAGDFLLLDRDSWFSLRGLPEWAGAPDHVAGMFVLVALGSGRVRETYLNMPFAFCKLVAKERIPSPPTEEDSAYRLTFLRAAGMAQAYIDAGPDQAYNGEGWGLAGVDGLEPLEGR
jgi:hypothetical protein